MNRHYGKKVVILLDEYDAPLQEAYSHGYWEKITAFIRSLFNCTFKTNPYMERGVMTGITKGQNIHGKLAVRAIYRNTH